MLTDKIANIKYRDRSGETKTIEMVLTAKQIEQTFIRRMQTLVPQSQIIGIDEVQQGELPLGVAGTQEPKAKAR